ncbi:MAG: ferritin family protein [Planctomycetes bacterium]|nr:ferritin family protein [Planctomycetota bacterium]
MNAYNKFDFNFASLSLRDALDMALLIEEEAQQRYEEFAGQMETHRSPEAGRFFRAMSKNEAKHGKDLKMRREKLFPEEPHQVNSSLLWDVEAPEYDKARAFMSVRQCMELALQCEIKAHDFFSAALEHIENPEVKQLFSELRDEEAEHQELVQKELDALPQTSEIDPENFVDDPVAQ